MRPPNLRRRPRSALLAGGVLALLAGCESGQFGFSGRDAEWSQARGAFSVVSASPQRAVLSARGNRVAVEPPPGMCLAEDSIETSHGSAFVLVGDCALEGAAGGLTSGSGGLDLPAAMPGMITVSISGDRGVSGRGDLAELEAHLKTPAGRELLGRGGDGAQVSVLETRRHDGILYVLVEDRAADALPVFAPRFWRAFVELNGRLVVATVSGFRDLPMDEGEMLRHLGDQVRQLQLANAVPVNEAPVQVAAAPRRERYQETGSGDEEPVGISTARTDGPDTFDPPPPDPAWATLQGNDATGALAAGSAPIALSDTVPFDTADGGTLSPGWGMVVAPRRVVADPDFGWAALQAASTGPAAAPPIGVADDPWAGVGGPDRGL